MKDREDDSDTNVNTTAVNPAYAAFQIAKAFTTSKGHDDPETRERAQQRIAKWEAVLHSILSGSLDYGSRTPVPAAPAWATLEVITGGFASGELLAAGPLQEHEKRLLDSLPSVGEGQERGSLNAYFLTEAGLSDLHARLQTNRYDVTVPEEGALLVVAWLVEKGYREEAAGLLNELSPYFTNTLGDHLDEMAKECFRWVCKRQQMKIDTWHARLIMLKNTAYAWRQMIFFLSLLPPTNISDFVRWAQAHRPALTGLVFAAEGRSVDGGSAGVAGVSQFLGWSKARHWLLPEESISEARAENGLQ